MKKFELKKQKECDIFKHVEVQNGPEHEQRIVGAEFGATKHLSLKELHPFIERDLFLEMKEGRLPEAFYKLSFGKLLGADLFQVEVHDLCSSLQDESSCRDIVDHIEAVILQVLWKYNHRDSAPDEISKKWRFLPEVLVIHKGVFLEQEHIQAELAVAA